MTDGVTDEVVVWRRRALVAVAAAVVVLVALVVVWRSDAADPVVVASSEPSSTAATVEPTPTEPTEPTEPSETAEPSDTAEPNETTGAPSERRSETVLFEGGPARGPWQQLGTVAEITHPGAPTSARYSWSNFWSDPEEEDQPDELWDQLVIEVTDQLAELGDPVDRPAFGGDAGSVPFNSFGGMQDIYPDDEVFTAYWSGVFEDDIGVGRAYFWFAVSFDGEITGSNGPEIFREGESAGHAENAQRNIDGIRAWADDLGLQRCGTC